MTKVIHVHLIYEKRNYYFGSLSAVFETLTEEQVGIKKSSLLHAGMEDGVTKITNRAPIVYSSLPPRFATSTRLLTLCLRMGSNGYLHRHF